MRTSASKFFMLTIITMALAAAPAIRSAHAAGGDNPAPPASDGTKAKKKKNDKSSSLDDPRFLAGYSLERSGKFPEAIEQYRAALALSPAFGQATFHVITYTPAHPSPLGMIEGSPDLFFLATGSHPVVLSVTPQGTETVLASFPDNYQMGARR